jgi:hypothetical protein
MGTSSKRHYGKVKSLNKSRKVIVGVNDMATTHPELAKECLDDPTNYVAGTHTVLRWKCRKCGYEYKKNGNQRIAQKGGCGVCNGKIVVPGINDMATTHPSLAAECLDDPTKFVAGTGKRLRWKCGVCGHEWKTTGNQRTTNRSSCGLCANSTVVPGINDMATTHPSIAKECLDDPTMYVAGTSVKLRWKCLKCGYEYTKRGCNRTRGDGCGCCSKKFVVAGINDKATTHPHLAKECLDDPTKHMAGTQKRLRWRCGKCGHTWSATGNTRAIQKSGCGCCSNNHVVVGINDMATTHPHLAADCLDDPTKYVAGTTKRLRWFCSDCKKEYRKTGQERLGGGKCGCINHTKSISEEKSMALTHPDLAKECFDDPTKHTAGTHKVLRWKCGRCGYEYQKSGKNRVKGYKCGCCSNTVVVPGINDMATTHPHLAKECLDDPTKYIAGTHTRLNWKCGKCGHNWATTGNQRILHPICGCCNGKTVVPGINDMATTRPDLAKECLDDPTKHIAGTNKRLRWRCSKCEGEWLTTGAERNAGRGCPGCAKGGHDQTRESFFYLVHRPGQFKIGIMNTETTRLDIHRLSGWVVIEKIMMEGELVRLLETNVKRLLKKKGIPTGAKAFREKFEGYTEAWQAVDLDVTNIDDLLEKLGTSFEALLSR